MKIERVSYAIFFALLVPLMSCTDKKTDKPRGETESSATEKPLEKKIEGYSIYRFPKFPVRLQYPDGWDIREDKIGVAFLVPKTGPDDTIIQGMTILVDTMYGVRMSLDQYKKIVIADLDKRTADFTLTESEETLLDGEPAYRIGYRGTFNQSTMSYLSMFCIKDDIVCIIGSNFLAESAGAYRETVEKIVSSLEFL